MLAPLASESLAPTAPAAGTAPASNVQDASSLPDVPDLSLLATCPRALLAEYEAQVEALVWTRWYTHAQAEAMAWRNLLVRLSELQLLTADAASLHAA
jgi:hypothetical protein